MIIAYFIPIIKIFIPIHRSINIIKNCEDELVSGCLKYFSSLLILNIIEYLLSFLIVDYLQNIIIFFIYIFLNYAGLNSFEKLFDYYINKIDIKMLENIEGKHNIFTEQLLLKINLLNISKIKNIFKILSK